MTKILKVYQNVENPKYWEAIKNQNRLKAFFNAFSFGPLVDEPYWMKNPRIAEIFNEEVNVVKNWHINNGYFYIEVEEQFKALKGEVYEQS